MMEPGYEKWLSLGFLRSTSVMSTLNRLQLANFKASEKPLMVIFKIGKEWYESNKTAVPVEYISEVVERDLIPKKVVSLEELEHMYGLLEFCYKSFTSPIETVERYIQGIIASFIEDRQVRSLADALKSTNDLYGVVDQMKQAINKASVVKVKAIDPMAGELPIVAGEKKKRWNCDFLDSITGGAIRGETTLFLAPSGGGKTLSNIQIACSSILNTEDKNECSLIFSYEQAVIPGLTNRVYSYMLGKRVDFFQGLDPKEMEALIRSDKALYALWKSKKERTEGRLFLHDMLQVSQEQGCQGIKDIESAIKECQDSGKNPRYVGIDWFGPFITGYMTSGKFSGKAGNRPKYEIMAEAADDLRKLGMELGVNMFIFHQLGTQASTKRPIDLPSPTDAYECKTIHQWMDTVICVGNRTPSNNLAHVYVPKHRNGEPHIKACIQMEGAYSRWKYISDRVIDDGNGGLIIPGSYGVSDSSDGEDENSSSPKSRKSNIKKVMNSINSEYLL
jgi:hypothetical protein